MNRILIVDDVTEIAHHLCKTLKEQYPNVIAVTSIASAIAEVERSVFDLIIADIEMMDAEGKLLLNLLAQAAPGVPRVALTPYGSTLVPRQFGELGAYDFIEKPYDKTKLFHSIARALEHGELIKEIEALRNGQPANENVDILIGNSASLQHVRDKIQLIAGTDAATLINGESGTGKEMAARLIHRQSERSQAAIETIHCAGVPTAVLEKELFGEEGWVPDGDLVVRIGKLEQADQGTVILCDVDEIDGRLQDRLFAFMQTNGFARVGGSDTIASNVRIIATTKADLKSHAARGTFREDLFYRLNGMPLERPSLRNRKDDVTLLINHFVDMFSRENQSDGVTLTESAVEKLCNAYWKGNIRQLHNVIERAVVMRAGATLNDEYFRFEDARDAQLAEVENVFRFGSVREMEKLMILNRLVDNNENRTRSAETLDISVRTLRNKLNEYNVPKRRSAAPVKPEPVLV